MKLTIHEAGAARDRLGKRLRVMPDSEEGLCALLRAEVHARGHAPRAVSVERVGRLLEGVVEVPAERLKALCEVLVREGDLVLGPGGQVWATPLRVVPLPSGVARVVSSAPDEAVEAQLGRRVTAQGPTRRVLWEAGLEAAVSAAGGRVLSPEEWAGLDRTPHADREWLDGLAQRLTHRGGPLGDRPHEMVAVWQGLVGGADGAVWRREAPAARLWRGKGPMGRWRWAWTARGDHPGTDKALRLTRDQAWRTLFALAVDAGAPIRGARREEGELSLAVPLPTAEYRYVSLLAANASRMGAMTTWSFKGDEAAAVAEVLGARLGIVWPSAEEAAGREAIAAEGVQAPDIAPLDEPLPIGPAMGPLLRMLELRIYRDVLDLDIGSLLSRQGVGRKKIARLKDLKREAERRAGRDDPSAPSSQVPVDGPYEDSDPLEVLGRLPSRIRTIVENLEPQTIRALRLWHAEARPETVRNYGRSTHGAIATTLERLDAEGHEALVFGGPVPETITALAERFMGALRKKERPAFELRLIEGRTLEEAGQVLGVTRERVRQVVESRFALYRSGWGGRARELLEPGLALLETSGGVALTRRVLESLGSPPRWTMQVALGLAGDVDLHLDIIPGLSATMPSGEFSAMLEEMKVEAQERLEMTVSASAVTDLLGEFGLTVPSSDLPEIADAMLGVTISGESAYLSKRAALGTVLAVLHEAGGPVSAEEIAQRVLALDPDSGASARSVAMQFGRSRQVLSYGRGLWIHQDHMPVSREALDSLAQRLLPEVRAAGGAAVSVRKWLARQTESGSAPSDLTPFLLRDALLQTGEVRGWRAGTDVAWLGGEVSRTSNRDWLKIVASELPQPFTAAQIVPEVSRRSGNLESSVYSAFQAETADILLLTRGRYVAVDAIFPTRAAFHDAMQAVVSHVNATPVLHARKAADALPALRDLTDTFGPELVWGIAHRAPELKTRMRGLLMWPASSGDRTWDVLARQFLTQSPVCDAAALARFFEMTAGLRDMATVRLILREGLDEGHLEVLGQGWYVSSHLGREEKLQALRAHPTIMKLVFGRVAFVKESPARDLLEALKERHDKGSEP